MTNTEDARIALSNWLEPLDACALECDGMSRCISILLNKLQIPHEVLCGRARARDQGVNPHFWIELPHLGLQIDYRARMWLGQHEYVPHGVFATSELATGVSYEGECTGIERLSPGMIDGDFMFAILAGRTTQEFLDRVPALVHSLRVTQDAEI